MKLSIALLFAGLKSGLMKPKDVLPGNANILQNSLVDSAIERAMRMDEIGCAVYCAFACLVNRASLSSPKFLTDLFINSNIKFFNQSFMVGRKALKLYRDREWIKFSRHMSNMAAIGMLTSTDMKSSIDATRDMIWDALDMEDAVARIFSANLVALMRASEVDPSVQDDAQAHIDVMLPIFEKISVDIGVEDSFRKFMDDSQGTSNCERAVGIMSNIFYVVNRLGYPLSYDDAQSIASPDYVRDNIELSDKSAEFLNGLDEKF